MKIIIDYLSNNSLNEKVEVFWSNLNKFSILCDIQFIIEHLDHIFDEDWDFWIVSQNEKWIIESYHEDELSIFCMSKEN